MSIPRAIRQLPRTLHIASTLRTLTSTIPRSSPHEKVAETEVPVVAYTEGTDQPQHDVIKVDQSKAANTAGPIVEVAKVAFAIEKDVVSKLPPTLKKFMLDGKVAIVTGGARGLGWNMAQSLAEVGAKAIAIVDVQQDLGDKAAAELHKSTGVPVQFYKVDIRDGNAIAEVVSKVTESFGSIDILINSAGIADSNIKAEEYGHEKFRRLIDINVTGAFLIAQACGRQMIKQAAGGSIILIASMSGSVVNFPQEQSCYNASKAAVIQLSKSLAAEWARHGIRVNSISPGYMDTVLNQVPALDAQKKIWKSMTPQARLGNIDELNNLAVYLASDASTFVTGSNCVIDVTSRAKGTAPKSLLIAENREGTPCIDVTYDHVAAYLEANRHNWCMAAYF